MRSDTIKIKIIAKEPIREGGGGVYFVSFSVAKSGGGGWGGGGGRGVEHGEKRGEKG